MNDDTLSFDVAHSLLTYDPDTGVLRWRDKRKDALSKFSAGAMDHRGYIKIMINRKNYQAHRIAWLLSHGKWPDKFIDHINQIKDDNRLCNLRDVGRKANSENVGQRRAVWLKGTAFHAKSGLWHARIGHNYKSLSLGYFKTQEEAQHAYLTKKRELHAAFVE